ncbi:hypothetical protein [Luteolibacter sp. Populi]|uniref:hypothetical protein n=1 Tax=Luteolibacter sp. Populi TaxID=3230487 RepID=UPI003465EC4E
MRIISSVLLFIAAGFLVGCHSDAPVTRLATKQGEQVPVPPFSIAITLDNEAREKLENAGESIKGWIVFDGDGTRLPGEKTAPHREVFLGTHDFELERSGTIRIKDATVSKEAYARLSDRNYHFTINVVSGRRSFGNNVLSGGFAMGKFEDLADGKPVRIYCSLLDTGR